MKLKKIHLEICMKCQNEIGDAMFLSIFSNLMVGNEEGRVDGVFLCRRGGVCGKLCLANQRNRDFINFLEKRIDMRFNETEISDYCRMKQIRRSARTLNDAMKKFPCECFIEENVCPYLLEQTILDAKD